MIIPWRPNNSSVNNHEDKFHASFLRGFVQQRAIILAAALSVAACGGRVAKPVLAESALDPRLSCAHLRGEYDNNTKRFAELQGEKRQSSASNAGFLITNPLFLDTQGTFKKESEALLRRNERLKTLMFERGCDGPGALQATSR